MCMCVCVRGFMMGESFSQNDRERKQEREIENVFVSMQCVCVWIVCVGRIVNAALNVTFL